MNAHNCLILLQSSRHECFCMRMTSYINLCVCVYLSSVQVGTQSDPRAEECRTSVLVCVCVSVRSALSLVVVKISTCCLFVCLFLLLDGSSDQRGVLPSLAFCLVNARYQFMQGLISLEIKNEYGSCMSPLLICFCFAQTDFISLIL